MKRDISFLLVVFVLLIVVTQNIQANEISVNSSLQSINQGDSFQVWIDATAPISESDIYSTQFDLEYDPTLLIFNSIVEGNFLNGDGAESIFGYNLVEGKIKNIYISRYNTQQGIHLDKGVLVVINFTAISPGISNINLSNVLWVNSTITNQSVEMISPNITHTRVIINSSFFCGDGICNNGELCSTCSTDCGGCATGGNTGGGSSSGGGSSPAIIPDVSNKTNQTESINKTNLIEEVNEEINNETNNSYLEDSLTQESNSFLSLTGEFARELVNPGSSKFNFIIALLVFGGGGFLLFKKYNNKNKQIKSP